LGGLVHTFILEPTNSITGPVALQYGDETPHWGFLVNWMVKDTSNAAVVPGDPSVTW
jgi:hypothetical protein